MGSWGIDLNQVMLQQLLYQGFDQILDWAESEVQRAAKHGRVLGASEIELARRSGVQNPDRIRILESDQIRLPLVDDSLAGAAGLTLGYAIFARRDALGPRLISHEARHVHQFETCDCSLDQFLREYLRQIIKHGYGNAPWEIDARRFEQPPV